MSDPRSVRGRSRSVSRGGPVVAVTGAAGPVGRAVTARLAARVGRDGGPGAVIAVDEARPSLDGAPGTPSTSSRPGTSGVPGAAGVQWRFGDPTRPDVVRHLDGADVVVHLADPGDLQVALAQPARQRRARAVRAVQAVSTAAAAVGAHRLVVVTSAMVYGARADNPVPLPEDAPLRADLDQGIVGDLLEVERIAARVPRVHPGLAVTVLRPAALVGPGIDTAVTRHFEAPRVLTVRGADTRWQFCHVDDLGEAVGTALAADLDGVLTVGADGALGRDDVERLTGMRRVEVPPGLAFGTAERLHRLGVTPMPAGDLAYVVHPWVVSAERLRAAGWRPATDNAGCLAVLVDEVRGRVAVAGRRMERRDAALGAAGAAVAVVATAAVLRQARSRRGWRGRPSL